MPIRSNPAQDPNAFITYAAAALLVGDPPDARAIEIQAHPIGPATRGANWQPGYVSLRFCGTRGGFIPESAHLDLLPQATRDLAADLRALVSGQVQGAQATFDPAVTQRERHATSSGTFSATITGPNSACLAVRSAGWTPSRRVSQPPVVTDLSTLLDFAARLDRAADVADCLASPFGQL